MNSCNYKNRKSSKSRRCLARNREYKIKYTPLGPITKKINARGEATNYSYYDDNLMHYEGANSFEYDNVGNMTAFSDEIGTTQIEYDELYRITKVAAPQGEVSYSYDANGNKTQMIYPDGKAVNYEYDEQNRVSKLIDHDGTAISYTYDYAGRLKQETHHDGAYTNYGYDNDGKLVSVKEVDKSNKTQRQTTITYDDKGNIIHEHRTGIDIEKTEQDLIYKYDAADKLTQTKNGSNTSNYTYDLAGNIAHSGLTYDADGNLTSDGKNTYEYDKQNRLIKGTNADGETSEYIYNALGNRIWTIENKKNPNYSARTRGYKNGSELFPDYTEVFKFGRAFDQKTWETTTGAIMQNEYITVERSYLIDLTSPANRDIFVNEKGAYTQRYVYGIDGKRISAEFDYAENTHRGEPGENISSDKAVEIGKVYYRSNQLNSSTYILNKDGTTRAHIIYDEWGKPLTPTNQGINNAAVENVNNFTGYTYDEVLGIYYAQARFYNPEIKRFMQIDPIKDGLNWYVYCDNNPVNYIDLFGLAKINFNGQIIDIGNGYKVDGEYWFSLRSVIAALGGVVDFLSPTVYFYLLRTDGFTSETYEFKFDLRSKEWWQYGWYTGVSGKYWAEGRGLESGNSAGMDTYFRDFNNTNYVKVEDIVWNMGINGYYEVYYEDGVYYISSRDYRIWQFYHYNWSGKHVTTSFLIKVKEVADNLGIQPDDLMAVMASESRLDPSVENGIGATGLIQFMPTTAASLGTSTASLSRMNAIQQMDYVYMYLKPYVGRMKTLGDIYMSILWPAGVGQSEDYVLWESGSITYTQNNGLDIDKNGLITKWEATQKVIERRNSYGNR